MRVEDTKTLIEEGFLLTSYEYKKRWRELYISYFGDQIYVNLVKMLRNGFEQARAPPFPDIEIEIDFGGKFGELVTHIRQDDVDAISEELETLNADILLLSGQRLTPASVRSSSAIPPARNRLVNSANSMYNEFLTHAARAWTKHAHRCNEDYWDTPKRSPQTINQEGNGQFYNY